MRSTERKGLRWTQTGKKGGEEKNAFKANPSKQYPQWNSRRHTQILKSKGPNIMYPE